MKLGREIGINPTKFRVPEFVEMYEHVMQEVALRVEYQ